MTRTGRFLAAGLAALGMAFSADAQTAGDEEFLFLIELITADCMDAVDFGEASDAVVASCKTSLAEIEEFMSEEDMSLQDVHSWNHIHYARSFIHHTLGTEYAVIDDGLSARACHEVELAWKDVAQINMTAPLPDMADLFREARQMTSESAAYCRQHHAAPDWATPLD